MTMPRMIYLIGAPGSGKSTLMVRLTDGLDREPAADAPVAHDVLIDPQFNTVVGAELGKRRELFSGTDTLPSSIISKAVPWIESRPYELVLAEGARLANRRFIMSASTVYDVTLAMLDHRDVEEWREARSQEIGRVQHPAWVAGRLTASRNLVEAVANRLNISVLIGHPRDLYHSLAAVISTDG